MKEAVLCLSVFVGLKISKVEMFFSGCIVIHYLTVSVQLVFVCDKSLESDGTPCVDLALSLIHI